MAATTEHSHKAASWVTVGLLIVAAAVLGFAFVLRSIPLAVLGVVIGLAGVVLGVTAGVMDDTG